MAKCNTLECHQIASTHSVQASVYRPCSSLVDAFEVSTGRAHKQCGGKANGQAKLANLNGDLIMGSLFWMRSYWPNHLMIIRYLSKNN